MRRLAALLLVTAAASCGRGDEDTNGAGPVAPRPGSLTGLYEGPAGDRRNQLCLIEREGQATTFGLITWGQGDTNCSGWGRAERTGGTLRLSMDGDQSCVVEARMEGNRIALPDRLPEGCAYYCGPGARLAGATFTRTGSTEEDAARAVDLVGDRLCGAPESGPTRSP